jgi:multidrug efflux system membrane fusion protein
LKPLSGLEKSLAFPGLESLPKASLVFLLTLLLAVAACSGEKKAPPPATVPVLVATVTERSVPVEIRNIGNVDPYATVSIKSRLAGQLLRVNFKEGQDVKEGDLLFVIDPRPYETALKQAEANLERDKALAGKAQSDLKRYAELIQKQFVSQQDYDQAKATAESLGATVNADQVAVQNAKLNLSYCYIKAPITGRTGSLLANQGNMIKENADTAMLVINQIQPIYVTFSVPERNLPTLKKFMAQEQVKVDAIMPMDPEHPETGVLTFINNTVDLTTGTIQCKATFDNTDKKLWPGLFVNVVVKLTHEHAILVPSQAIQSGQEGQFVWVVKPDLTVETRAVETERGLDGDVVVKQGLQAGERVVTDGQIRLVKGAKVEIKSGL